MNYKGYQIEEELPGQFSIYQSRESWLNQSKPLDIDNYVSIYMEQ